MATSDLTEILKKPDWRRDDDQERRLCDLILQQLDDTSGDVSSLATKWCVVASWNLTFTTCQRHVKSCMSGYVTRNVVI